MSNPEEFSSLPNARTYDTSIERLENNFDESDRPGYKYKFLNYKFYNFCEPRLCVTMCRYLLKILSLKCICFNLF